MKKLYVVGVICLIVGGALMSIYDALSGSKKEPVVEPTEQVVEALDIEFLSYSDKSYMGMNYSKYKWFESCFQMNDFLDADDAIVVGLSNVFQVEEKQQDGGTYVQVFCLAHTSARDTIDTKPSNFWVGDEDMLDFTGYMITFNQAYEKLKEANFKLPHSKYVVLRKQVGPKACNPQYIFGNAGDHTYVDAITGDVTKTNPCGLPEDK